MWIPYGTLEDGGMQAPRTTEPDFDASAVYSAAATDYEAAAVDFWAFLTHRTHELLELTAGDRVLDAATGTGTLLPLAATSVGLQGAVVGVDFAPGMLRLAQQKVRGLPMVRLALADVVDVHDNDFDAIACVLGVFFADDMPGFVSDLLGRLRPGGRLVATVFGEAFYEPLIRTFVDAVREQDPEMPVAQPWQRTATVDALTAVFTEADCHDVRIEEEHRVLPIDSDGWRRIARGSGLRRTLEALGTGRADRVLERCDAATRLQGVDAVEVSARYAIVSR